MTVYDCLLRFRLDSRVRQVIQRRWSGCLLLGEGYPFTSPGPTTASG